MTLCLSLVLLISVLSAVQLLWGLSGQARLDNRSVPQREDWPSLSLVVAARNEERHLARALETWAQLDYPKLEMIVVDDRSEDGTTTILEAQRQRDPRLKSLRVDALPPGWLGKNHALHLGAQAASGDWLLFADGDVLMKPEILRKAVGHALDEKLDHLTLLVRIWSRSWILQPFIAFFGFAFCLHTRPWEAKNPHSKRHIGIGAFNLVRRTAYAAIGGHQAVALRPDDDLRLGKALKEAGFRQECAIAVRSASVEWYASFAEAARGLEKNLFAGLDYRTSLAIAGFLVPPLLFSLPALWIFVGNPTSSALAQASYAVTSLAVGVAAGGAGQSPLWGFLHPVTALVFSGLGFRTIFKNLRDGGIYWRGTFYPLSELKKGK
jgi:hypothetical protein